MRIKIAVLTSLKSLKRNPMRALLTTLGIVIGIASVITMMEIGQGSSIAIQKTISSMGANTIIILPGTATSGGVTFGSGSITTLTPQDCDAIKKECPSVLNTAPIIRARTQVIYGNKNWVPYLIYGTTPAYLSVQDWKDLSEGEPFTERDVLNGNKVCLVGKTIVRELFDGKSPVGKEIRIMNVPFKVTGVLRAKGANMMGMDQDDIILAPWTSIKYRVTNVTLSNANQSSNITSSSTTTTTKTTSNLYPSTGTNFYPVQSDIQIANHLLYARFSNIDQIILSARSSKEIDSAIEEITKLLHERHHIGNNEPDDFMIRNLTQLTETLSSTTRVITNLLLCIAMISLVVGGIGIMNIMLVCVSERTREIGLRMAVGARQRDILRQFLIESVLLCMTGGIIGIIFGHGASLIVAKILKWPIAVSPIAIILAVTVSISVGIIFGYYPAWKASRLDPIEALRYE